MGGGAGGRGWGATFIYMYIQAVREVHKQRAVVFATQIPTLHTDTQT